MLGVLKEGGSIQRALSTKPAQQCALGSTCASTFHVSSLAHPERGVLVDYAGRLCPISGEARAGMRFWHDEMAWQIQAVPALAPEVLLRLLWCK